VIPGAGGGGCWGGAPGRDGATGCPLAEPPPHRERQAAGADPSLPGQRLRRGGHAGGLGDQDGRAGAHGGAAGARQPGGPRARGQELLTQSPEGGTVTGLSDVVSSPSADGEAAGCGERLHGQDSGAGEAAEPGAAGAGGAAGEHPWVPRCWRTGWVPGWRKGWVPGGLGLRGGHQ